VKTATTPLADAASGLPLAAPPPPLTIPRLPVAGRSVPLYREPALTERALREPAAPGPRYAESFQCIGAECEDSCCKAWDLRLDQATYERYQLIPVESLLGKVVQSSVVPLPEPRSKHWYARILLNESLECPFLTEEKWCGIQQTLGEEALSHTCKTYPRIHQRTPTGKRETTLHLSCPEASRLVLLTEHPGSGDSVSSQISGHISGQYIEAAYEEVAAESRRARTGKTATAYLGEIRRFLLVLLRDRRYSVGERMFLMGTFAGRLRPLLDSPEASGNQAAMIGQLPDLLRDYCLLAGQGTLRPALGQVTSQPALQLGLTLGLVNQRLDRALNSLRFLDVVKEFLEGVGYQPGTPPEKLVPAFQRAEKQFYAPLMKAHPWILENYLIHAVYRTLFPFGEARNKAASNPEHEFRSLSTHFVAIRTLLVGMAGLHGATFDTSQVVRLVQSYSRMVDHHAEFLSAAGGLLESRNLVDAGSLAGLLLEGAGRPAIRAASMA